MKEEKESDKWRRNSSVSYSNLTLLMLKSECWNNKGTRKFKCNLGFVGAGSLNYFTDFANFTKFYKTYNFWEFAKKNFDNFLGQTNSKYWPKPVNIDDNFLRH